MSKYSVEIKEQAQLDLKRLLRSEPNAYSKALQLISELYETPRVGTGHPEPLSSLFSQHTAITKINNALIATPYI